MKKKLLTCSAIKKSYQVGVQKVPVIKDISLDVVEGDFMVIFGPSGCGKSTLLHILLGLEAPSEGKVLMDERNLYTSYNEDGRSELRKKSVGMIYQQPNWIKSLTVLDNVAFPLLLNGMEQSAARNIARTKLKEIGMNDWANYLPTELSSGQQQKVALARGVSTNPRIIIADEPTGNLDYKSGMELMELLTLLNNQGKTIVMVTHDLDYLTYADTAVEMFDGQLIKIHKGQEIEDLIKTRRIAKPPMQKKINL